MNLPLRLLAATALTVACCVLSLPASAVDNQYFDASAGAACHAANPAATKFQYTNHDLANLNPTAQFVVCDLHLHDFSSTPAPLTYLAVEIQSTAEATVTCVAQTGMYFSGTVTVRSSQTRSYSFVFPGGSNSLIFDTSTLARINPYDVLTLNCKMDPNTRLGLIQVRE